MLCPMEGIEPKPEVVFARIERKPEPLFMGGVSLDAIVADVKGIFGELPVAVLDRKEIPADYKWSAMRVEKIQDWRENPNQTYLLIKNYENYAEFKRQFPAEASLIRLGKWK